MPMRASSRLPTSPGTRTTGDLNELSVRSMSSNSPSNFVLEGIALTSDLLIMNADVKDRQEEKRAQQKRLEESLHELLCSQSDRIMALQPLATLLSPM